MRHAGRFIRHPSSLQTIRDYPNPNAVVTTVWSGSEDRHRKVEESPNSDGQQAG